jgi:hypothetical protein
MPDPKFMPAPYCLATITCGITPVSGKALASERIRDVGGGLVSLGRNFSVPCVAPFSMLELA